MHDVAGRINELPAALLIVLPDQIHQTLVDSEIAAIGGEADYKRVGPGR